MIVNTEKIQLAMAGMQLVSTILVFVAVVLAVIYMSSASKAYMENTTESRAVWNADRIFTVWLQCKQAESMSLKLPEINPCGDS